MAELAEGARLESGKRLEITILWVTNNKITTRL